MATFTNDLPEIMEARDKMIFFKNYVQQKQKFREIYEVRPSKKGYEDRLEIAGLGTFSQKLEGAPVTFSDPVQGTRRRVVHTTYALGYRATWEAISDDQWAILEKMPADLGDSARDHEERIATDVLNDGFDGNRHTGVDGASLFNATHTSLRAEVASQSNVLAPAVALSVTGLEEVMTMAMTTQSREGRYIDLEPAKLVIHPSNAHVAYVLLNTATRPGTADRDVSTVVSSRSGLTVVATPYLSSTTQWSVHARVGKNTLKWNQRATLFFKRANDANTFDQMHYAAYRGSAQFDEWRGNWGSTGLA